MAKFSLIDQALQPKLDEYDFDLKSVFSSIISVRVDVPKNAFTASSLGIERSGHGVLIQDSGLILTIGYLTIEAENIWLIDETGKAVSGHVVAYDQETGFALIQALGSLAANSISFGSSSSIEIGEEVILAGSGGQENAIKASLLEKREFAGYWEYLLNEAMFTSPPHPFWGGAALISKRGKLIGIGSLFIQQNQGNIGSFDGNMVVPIDLLEPIIDDLLTFGRVNKLPRPWLGTMVAEAYDSLVIAGVVPGGPAEMAGLEPGDNLNAIDGQPASNLASFFRKLWSLGDAGIDVTLTVEREKKLLEILIKSADRNAYLLQPNVH